MNRRQLDPVERVALARYREGDVAASQAIRTEHGWEHDLGTPLATRQAMAEAVVVAADEHGPEAVMAFAVSHADCEDLADRIRAIYKARGELGGPTLTGPAWAGGERGYATGDRVLLHAPLRTGGVLLRNGNVLTVTAVTGDGLIASDDAGRAHLLPSAFVAGRRSDGDPNCSHAWARTVDGAQGGTWHQVHLLGTAALDRFTGYVGQSRSQMATHTWNVKRLSEVDHGGVLADRRDASEEVLSGLERLPDPRFAAHDDPYEVDRRLSAERADHLAVLATRPPHVSAELGRARRDIERAEESRHWAQYRLRRQGTNRPRGAAPSASLGSGGGGHPRRPHRPLHR